MCFLFFSKKSKLGSSEQEASLSVSKIQGHLVPYRVRKCVPTAVSGDVDILKVLGFLLLQHMSFQWRWRLPQGSMFHEVTAYLFDFDYFLTQGNSHNIKRPKPDKQRRWIMQLSKT